MIKQNEIFILNGQKMFFEGKAVYNAETGEKIIEGSGNIKYGIYDSTHYANPSSYYVFIIRNDEGGNGFMMECEMEAIFIANNNGVSIESSILYNSNFYRNGYDSCESAFSYDGNYFNIDASHNFQENYPGRGTGKKFIKDFEKKEENPTVKPEIINNPDEKKEIPEKFFKDIEEKNFEFKIKEVKNGENTVILVDNSEFNNYVANKINEFTTFTYIGTFFIFTILSFYFIKSLLGK